jgi:hypothetical protein
MFAVAFVVIPSSPRRKTVTMPYLLSVWFDEPYEDPDLDLPEAQRQMAQTSELIAEMERAGAWCENFTTAG